MELQAVSIGTVIPHNAQITLVSYDPDWPRLFTREADRLRSVLGDEALRIEHVGSTSVPCLIAKPIIDIVLVVPDSADEPRYVPRLEAVGYVLRIREPGWFEHRLFKGPDTSINLHTFSSGVTEVERMLRFRDRLRDDDRGAGPLRVRQTPTRPADMAARPGLRRRQDCRDPGDLRRGGGSHHRGLRSRRGRRARRGPSRRLCQGRGLIRAQPRSSRRAP